MAATLELEPFTLLGPRELIDFVPAPDDDHTDDQTTEVTAELKKIEFEDSGEDSDSDSDSDSELDEEKNKAAQMYPMGYTQNGALTFLTSVNSCVDFFFQVVPQTTKASLLDLLSKAWNEDPLMALKLVFHLRGVRGTGKSDKLNFYEAASWLYQEHPATLNANVAKIPQFGYYKDLLELLQRIVEGEEETLKRKEIKRAHHGKKKAGERKAAEWKLKKSLKEANPAARHHLPRTRRATRKVAKAKQELGYFGRKGAAARAAKKEGTLKPRVERVAEDIENGKRLKQAATEARKNKHLKLASRVVAKYKSEPEFATLYNSVSRVFAEALAKDLEELSKNGRKARISLAAKWCPSLDSSYDRQTLLCEGIACRYFPRSGFRAELDEHRYRVAARERLRKEVLSPLRKALELPEVYMSAKEWNRLPYTRVASVAMKRYKELFLKHDEGRFKGFLDKVEKGEKKIAAGALLPHEIVAEAIGAGEGARVSELQWRSMVEEMKTNGSLVDSISICDVSGSMIGEPMEVAIALGMLTAELAEEPWKNRLITFSHQPEFFTITGKTLREKHEFVRRMPWKMNTDFQKVFDLLLEMAREKKLPGERMVKRVFVYSDMEFDSARSKYSSHSYVYYGSSKAVEATSWETDYAQICRKFEEAGYGEPPEIVFWNLRSGGMMGGKSTPVMAEQKGVAMVSGFSKNLLKLFMDRSGKVEEIKPINIMKEAVSGPLYDDLVVV